MKQFTVTPADDNQRSDKYLLKILPKASKGFIYKMLRKKNIKLNDEKMIGDEILKAGDRIAIYFSDETFEQFSAGGLAQPSEKAGRNQGRTDASYKNKLDIVFEDEQVLVLAKPTGLLSQPDGSDESMTDHIEAYLAHKGMIGEDKGVFKPGICNRLDRNTSGIIVAGKTVRALQALNEAVKEHQVDKKYLTIVKGQVKEAATIRGYLVKDEKTNKATLSKEGKGDRIVTHYKPVKSSKEFTLLEVTIETGKSHQIRLHLASIGHPIIGDGKYGDATINARMHQRHRLSHHLLHAYKYRFLKLGEPLKYLEGKNFEAPIPPLFKKIQRDLLH